MISPTLSARLSVRDYPKDLSALMDQKWRHLLFIHWEYDAKAIQKTLPQGLYVDTFQDKAYIGIVPFWMQGIKPKFFPFLPGLSDFFELNCRTYVYDEKGTPGVWFYSLDANQQLAVQMARQFFYLPYRYAFIQSLLNQQQQIEYLCQSQDKSVRMEFVYKGEGETYQAKSESLEFFLIERYILFVNKNGQLASGRVHHTPYPLNRAQVIKWDSQLFNVNGLNNPNRPPDHLLFSSGVDVEIFGLQELAKK